MRTEKQADVAAEFDQIHSIERANAVGSVDVIIQSGELRPYLVAALGRGIDRTRARLAGEAGDQEPR